MSDNIDHLKDFKQALHCEGWILLYCQATGTRPGPGIGDWDWGLGMGIGDGNWEWELGMGNGKMGMGKWEMGNREFPQTQEMTV